MKASGNGRPEQCAANLLKITRGEVPYERLKGLTAGAIDEPTQQASISLEADAEWLIRTYEPRVDTNDIEISISNQKEGAYLLGADINVKREEGTDG
jgi:phage baseplate assembly protein W